MSAKIEKILIENSRFLWSDNDSVFMCDDVFADIVSAINLVE